MTKLKRIVALLVAAGAQPVPPPEPVTSEFELDAGYTLQYGVEWRLIRAGEARMSWAPEGSGYRADLHLESAGIVSKLYRVNDDYRASMTNELCASEVMLKAEEGKRRRQTSMEFTPGKVIYVERDLTKSSIALQKELDTSECVHEYLGALAMLRSMTLEPGSSTQLPITNGKKFAQVKVDAQERETVKTPLGTYKAIRYEVGLFNEVIIDRKARMYVWLTDDARKLPVQMRVRLQFLIGTITLQLEKIEQT